MHLTSVPRHLPNLHLHPWEVVDLVAARRTHLHLMDALEMVYTLVILTLGGEHSRHEHRFKIQLLIRDYRSTTVLRA